MFYCMGVTCYVCNTVLLAVAEWSANCFINCSWRLLSAASSSVTHFSSLSRMLFQCIIACRLPNFRSKGKLFWPLEQKTRKTVSGRYLKNYSSDRHQNLHTCSYGHSGELIRFRRFFEKKWILENFFKIIIFLNRCFRVCYHLRTKSMATIVGMTVHDCIRNVYWLLYDADIAIKVTLGHAPLTIYM